MGNKKRILVVDNEADQRNLMQQLLRRMGYDVQVAGDADQTLAVLAESAFDLVLIDLIMSGMDGIELCERVRRLRTGARLYAYTGYLDLYEPGRLERAGFDGWITKPIDVTRLEDTISAAIAAAP